MMRAKRRTIGVLAFTFLAAAAAFFIMPAGKAEAAAVSNIAVGEVNNLVVFVRFQGETEFVDAEYRDVMQDMYNTSDVSVKEYFKEVSLGKLTLNTHFLTPTGNSAVTSVEVSRPRDYYEPYDRYDNPAGYSEQVVNGKEHIDRFYREQQLVREVLRSVDIPLGIDLDNDNDGKVDSLTLMVSGTVGNDQWADLLWPHMTSLYDFHSFIVENSYYIPSNYWKTNPMPTSDGLNVGGLEFEDYDFLSEGYIMKSKLEGEYADYGEIGVICHELMHTLGALDYYSYEEDKAGYDSVGELDIMGSTNYMPQYPLSYIRQKMGWLEEGKNIVPVTSGGQYVLYPTTDDSRNIKAYKIALSDYGKTGEYFMIEARSNAGTRFDSELSSSGLVIYRVVPSASENGNMYGEDEVFVYRTKHAVYNPNGQVTNYLAQKTDGTVVNYSYSIFGQAQGDAVKSGGKLGKNAPETCVTEYGEEGTNLYLSTQHPDLVYYQGANLASYAKKNSGIAVENIEVDPSDGSVSFLLNLDGDKGSGKPALPATPMNGYPAVYSRSDTSVSIKCAAADYNHVAYTLIAGNERLLTQDEVRKIVGGTIKEEDYPVAVYGYDAAELEVPLAEYRMTVSGLSPQTTYKCYVLIVRDGSDKTAFFHTSDVTTLARGAQPIVSETEVGTVYFSSAYPQLVSVKGGEVTIAVKSSVANAWTYYMVVPKGAAAPDAREIMLGREDSAARGSFPITSNTKTTQLIPLDADRTYDIYVMIKRTDDGAESEIEKIYVNTASSTGASGITCGSFGRNGAATLAAGAGVLSVAAFLLMRRK